MQAEELTGEFGIAGILDFVETEHGLVKAAISLDGMAGGPWEADICSRDSKEGETCSDLLWPFVPIGQGSKASTPAPPLAH
jgi:hypothetical protein